MIYGKLMHQRRWKYDGITYTTTFKTKRHIFFLLKPVSSISHLINTAFFLSITSSSMQSQLYQ